MRTRSALAEIIYNGQSITVPMGQYTTGVTYTDNATGEGDTIDVKIGDPAQDWLVAMPTKGAQISAKLTVKDWGKEGDNRALECGTFILDDFSFGGPPTTGTISAISTPVLSAFKDAQRSKTWESVTVAEIAKDIASRAGVALTIDADASFKIASVEQSKESDAEFLTKLCEKYGFSIKIYSSKIIVFDREAYKKKPVVGTIDVAEMESWDWKTTLAGTYTGGTISYTNPTTNEEVTYTTGDGERLLECSEKADNAADAERILKAAIDNANHNATALNLSMMGDVKFAASQCWRISGLGQASGKYYIDKATHDLGSGYKVSLEMSRVAQTEAEEVADAVTLLAELGIINSPDYWKVHYNDVKYLGLLIVRMSAMIRQNKHGTGIASAEDAIAALHDANIINSPDYWANNHAAVRFLDDLLIQAANAITA